MSFLDKPVGEMSVDELTRLVRHIIQREIPPIPTQLLKLGDEDTPLLRPEGLVGDSDALIYNPATGTWENGKISAESLEAELVMAENVLIVGDPEAMHIRIGEAIHEGQEMVGIHSFEEDAMTVNFMVDTMTGDIYLKGRIDFGQNPSDPMMGGSRLLSENIIEILQQGTGSFQVPDPVQVISGTGINASTVAASWTSPTTEGNLLLAVVGIWDSDGTPPTPTNPSGWGSPIINQVKNEMRLVVWKIENAASRSGSQSVTLGDTVQSGLTLLEFSGVDVQDVAAVSNSGTSTSPSTGTSGTTTQTDEAWVAFILSDIDGGGQTAPTNDFEQLMMNLCGGNIITADARLGTYHKNVTATGTASMGVTIDTSDDWAGGILTFKAKTQTVTPPAMELVRLYAKAVDSVAARLHAISEDGVESAVALAEPDVLTRFEEYTASFNPPSVNAHSGNTSTFSITGLNAGDLILAARIEDPGNRGIHFFCNPEVLVDNQAIIWYFNTDTVALDHGTQTVHFYVVHRS